MLNSLLKIKPEEEVDKITDFLKETFRKNGDRKAVIGLSGGIDSTTSLYLLTRAIKKEKIIAFHLPYFDTDEDEIEEIVQSAGLSEDQLITIPIEDMVDEIADSLEADDNLRKGNIMARIRMIVLYDFAKQHGAMVVGTENRSEHHLGYFTRFGDDATDIEPLIHLYKTQVYEIAKYLKVPKSIINKPPSANLWEDQTDEKEMGFSYDEADPVLYLYFDKKNPAWTVENMVPGAKKIIEFAKKSAFKHEVPYHL
jgi:NAD+ synthase